MWIKRSLNSSIFLDYNAEISKEHVTSIFRAEESDKQETSVEKVEAKQLYTRK